MAHLGFDVRDYPGDDVMARLKANGPYEWVGYYLRSPNHPGASWMGAWRRYLQAAGWGVAVLYVGFQHDHLDLPNGTAHGIDAITLTAGEGFMLGTRIFLDVERHEHIDDGFAAYIRGFLDIVQRDPNGFLPAIYCHVHNADAIRAIAADVAPGCAFWVAGGANFGLDKSPADSGVAYASAWQGWLDTADPSGTVNFNIDVSVATTASPSSA